ncbi:hypothetical protein FJT64_006228 [Amphibalanus amphitrite]|uniref:Uncharacterized protein n=1 Tax=Amphibalanus amphitrite TaxID=1232801 RepID=A0A6A4VQ01_AMPAM|nr:hypothetical protein FJT64_006228 [Amphibalanus amphitrite]
MDPLSTTPSASEGGNLHEWWRWPGSGTSTARAPDTELLERHPASDLRLTTEQTVTAGHRLPSEPPAPAGPRPTSGPLPTGGYSLTGGPVGDGLLSELIPTESVSGTGHSLLTESGGDDLWYFVPASNTSPQLLNDSRLVFNSSSGTDFWGLPGVAAPAGRSPLPLPAPLLVPLALAVLVSIVSNGLVLASIVRHGRRGQPCLSAHLSQTAAALVCSLAAAPLLLGAAPAAALATAALAHASPALAGAVLLSAARRWYQRPLVGALAATWLLAGAGLLVVVATEGLRSLPPVPLLAALSPLLLTCYGAGLASVLAAGLRARLSSRWVEPTGEPVSRWPPAVAVLPPAEPSDGQTVKQAFPEDATRGQHSAASAVRWSVDVERSELDGRGLSIPASDGPDLPNQVPELSPDADGEPTRRYRTQLPTADGADPTDEPGAGPTDEPGAGSPEPGNGAPVGRMHRSDTFPISNGDAAGVPLSPGALSAEPVSAPVCLSVPDLSRRPTTVSELSAGSLLPPPSAAHDGYLGDHSTPPSGAPSPLKQRRQRSRRARDRRCAREALLSPRSWPVTPTPRPVRRRRPLLGRPAPLRPAGADRQGALLCLLTTLTYGLPAAVVLALVCWPASAQHLVSAYLLTVQLSAAVSSPLQALADLSVRGLLRRTVTCGR